MKDIRTEYYDLIAREAAAGQRATNLGGRAAGGFIDPAVERVKAILTLPEAKGREQHAQKFAFETDMSVEAARIVLSAIPFATTIPPVAERGAPLRPTAAGEFLTGGGGGDVSSRWRASMARAGASFDTVETVPNQIAPGLALSFGEGHGQPSRGTTMPRAPETIRQAWRASLARAGAKFD